MIRWMIGTVSPQKIFRDMEEGLSWQFISIILPQWLLEKCILNITVQLKPSHKCLDRLATAISSKRNFSVRAAIEANISSILFRPSELLHFLKKKQHSNSLVIHLLDVAHERVIVLLGFLLGVALVTCEPLSNPTGLLF